jgi:hypothetical protein
MVFSVVVVKHPYGLSIAEVHVRRNIAKQYRKYSGFFLTWLSTNSVNNPVNIYG